MHFTKMHGLGNEYLYVYGEVPPDIDVLCPRLSDRHFGAGSDGMIFIEQSEVADFKMRIFNEDGSVRYDKMVEKTAQYGSQTNQQKDVSLKRQLLDELVNFDEKSVRRALGIIVGYPVEVQKLASYRTSDGKLLFDAKSLNSAIIALADVIEDLPQKIWDVLDNPKILADIAKSESPVADLCEAIDNIDTYTKLTKPAKK